MISAGIDIGTTTISGVVLDMDTGKLLISRTVSNDSFIDTGNSWERVQDVDSILVKTQDILDELLELYPGISSIGLTGQMHGIVYLDCNGRAVSPFYTWQDGRGNRPEFDGQTAVEWIQSRCGFKVHTGYGLVSHFYNGYNDLVPAEAVTFCTIMDYFGMVLTGRKQPLVHTSNAASFGFFDVKNGCFLEDKMVAIGMDPAVLPAVTDRMEILGSYQGIPVTAAIGDNQASFLGAVGNKENIVLLNMGTGGQISVMSTKYFETSGIEARPFLDGKYLLVGASLCGGRAYAILERFFREYLRAAASAAATDFAMAESSGIRSAESDEVKAQYSIMEVLARKGKAIHASSGAPLAVDTAFSGTREEPDRRGSITGISEENFTPEALTYGVLHGMAKELYDLYRKIDAGCKISASHLVGSGNGLRKNPVLVEIFEDMFGTGLELSSYEEEAACGAAKSSCMIKIKER